MSWGVFDLRDDDEEFIHVVPCDDEGYMLPEHSFTDCKCHPRVEDSLVIHEHIN